MFSKRKLLLVVPILVVVFLSVVLKPSSVLAQNPLPQGMDYPFSDPTNWEILNGYNDGSLHGSVVCGDKCYDYFYAYYAFDFVHKDGQTAGLQVKLPTDVYYYRVQGSPELCIDMSIGTWSAGFDLYLEMCHINYTSAVLQNKGNVIQQFLPKGTVIGTVANAGDCPKCNPPHIHMAAHISPSGIPWSANDACSSSLGGFCRFPVSYEAYANFSLALGGTSYPPKETSLFQVKYQYSVTAISSGGGSTEGSGEPPANQIGNSKVDLFENTNFNPTQYGWNDPTNGWVNVPDYMNDRASSSQIDSGWSMLVAKDLDGGGAHKCLVSSYPDFSGAYYDNGDPMTDTISSVNVFHDSTCGGAYLGTRPGDTVTFWVDPPYWSTNWGVHDPFSGNLPDYLQNTMTSIGITPGWSAVLYEGPNLTGGFACFTSSDPDLTNDKMNTGSYVNDNPESVEVFHDSICGGRIHAPTVTLSAAISGPQANLVTVNAVWSGAAPVWQMVDFGDGAQVGYFGSSGASVGNPNGYQHYYAVGTYTLTFTVVGTDGVPYVYSYPIQITPPPTATPNPTATPRPTSVTTTINSFNANTGWLEYKLNWIGVQNVWNQCMDGDGPTQHIEYYGDQVNFIDHHYYPLGNFTFTCTIAGANNNKYVQSNLMTMVGNGNPTAQLPFVTVNSVVQPNRTVVFTVIISNAKSVNHILSYGSGLGSSNVAGNGTKTFTKSYPAGTYNVTMKVYGLNNFTYTLNQQLVIP